MTTERGAIGVIIFGHYALYPFFLVLFSLKVLPLCIILFIMCLLHWLDTLILFTAESLVSGIQEVFNTQRRNELTNRTADIPQRTHKHKHTHTHTHLQTAQKQL